jgi:adenylate cyclase
MAQHQIITFVFSDIEHSTQLAQQLREDYPEVLERHRVVIREAIAQYQGKEIDTAGDGFFMTFNDPLAAVRAAVQIQSAFHTQKWATDIGLKVRIGIHTGIALSTTTGYTGVDVHFASRVCSAAYGGQVLLSNATQKGLKDGLGSAALTLSNLGNYTLKDFADPVPLFQLNIAGLNQNFPKPGVKHDVKRIAVLPFINLTEATENDYVGEGMAEEIIRALGKVQGLRVAPQTSAFALKDQDLNVQQIGQKLNVNAVLRGQINAVNDHMKFAVELVNTDTARNIWSHKYDSAEEQLVPIQEEITQRVTTALGCSLPQSPNDPIQHRQTNNPEAYDYYLRGRRFYLQFSGRGIELALRMYEKAIEADHTYALAYAGMADCYTSNFSISYAPKTCSTKPMWQPEGCRIRACSGRSSCRAWYCTGPAGTIRSGRAVVSVCYRA